jgi:hypothetical protein
MKEERHAADIASTHLLLGVAAFAVRPRIQYLKGGSRMSPRSASSQERDYASWFEGIAQEISATKGRFDTATSKLRQDPGDRFQLIILARELVRYNIIAEKASSVSVPSSASRVHSSLLKALGEYNAASEAVSKGEVADLLARLKQGDKLTMEAIGHYRDWKKRLA